MGTHEAIRQSDHESRGKPQVVDLRVRPLGLQNVSRGQLSVLHLRAFSSATRPLEPLVRLGGVLDDRQEHHECEPTLNIA